MSQITQIAGSTSPVVIKPTDILPWSYVNYYTFYIIAFKLKYARIYFTVPVEYIVRT